MPVAGQIITIHREDPAEAIWRSVGSLDGVEPTYSNVLIATYIRQEGITAGGVYVPGTTFKEDEYMGNVGLVLKVGPMAFEDTDRIKFNGFRVRPKDWIVFRPSEGMRMQIKNHSACRLLADVHIRMTISHPDAVY